VLPFRFGSTFNSVALLLDFLQEKYAGFSTNLLGVQNCVELSLRMNWQIEANQMQPVPGAAQTGSSTSPLSGTEYMQALLKTRQHEQALHQQIETQVSELLHNLNQLAAAHTHVVTLPPHPGLKAAYLIARPKLALFRQEVGNLAAIHPEYHFALTGPWPPYNFVAN
jgi:hypothetical protein